MSKKGFKKESGVKAVGVGAPLDQYRSGDTAEYITTIVQLALGTLLASPCTLCRHCGRLSGPASTFAEKGRYAEFLQPPGTCMAVKSGNRTFLHSNLPSSDELNIALAFLPPSSCLSLDPLSNVLHTCSSTSTHLPGLPHTSDPSRPSTTSLLRATRRSHDVGERESWKDKSSKKSM